MTQSIPHHPSLLATLLLAAGATQAPLQAQQHGANDPSFNVLDNTYSGPGTSGGVGAVVHQPDGKSVIAGAFSSYNGVASSRMARLLPDGAIDPSFAMTTVDAGSIFTLALQPDGKFVIGGDFTSIAGVPRGRIARVDANGALDLSFSPGVGANSEIRYLALQPDGKVLVAGNFTFVDNVARLRVARLTSDGAVDLGFDSSAGANGNVEALVIRADGKIVIGGLFNSYGGVTARSVARLNADGSLDTGFDPGNGVFGTVLCMAEQPDGKLVLGGSFTQVHTSVRNRIARLHPDGALDTSFTPTSGAAHPEPNGAWVSSVEVQPDGTILAGGRFTSFGGVARNFVARLNANGSVDTTFDPGSGADDQVLVSSRRNDGRLLLGGNFTEYAGRRRWGCAQVNADGSVDSTFNPNRGASGAVAAIQPLSSGKTLIAGDFLDYNDVARRGIARIDANGELDLSFDPGSGANGRINAVALQSDGKILIGGRFTSVDGVSRSRLARLHADGALDTSFDPGLGADSDVLALAQRDDGGILVGGFFLTFNGLARRYIACLTPTGALDPSFHYGIGPSGAITRIQLATDGKILLGGAAAYDNYLSRGIVRLNPSGTVDTGFVGQMTGSFAVRDFELLDDGRIVLCGLFTQYAGVSRLGVVRIHADGALDTSFDPGAGVPVTCVCFGSPEVTAMEVQSDGALLLGGYFDSFDGVARRSLVRLEPDGAVDLSFDPGSGAQYQWGGTAKVQALALQTDGTALIGGDFTSYDQTVRHRIARVFAQDMQGVSYCTAGTSTNGCTAHITGVGDPSTAASSGFTLHVSGVEGAKQGLIYYGVSGRTGSTWGAGGTSFQCVKPPTQRTGAQSSGGAAGQCDGAFATDWLAYIAAHPSALGTPLTIGAVVNAQAWYRDPPAVKTTNLSDALEFVIAP